MDDMKLPEVEDKKDAKEESVQYDVTHAPTPHVVKVKKSPAKIIFTILLILVLLGGNVYLGYMYYQEKENAKDLQQQLDTSKSQASNQDEETTNTSEAADTVSYTAEVGKFTLTLPNKYVIIKNIDGGYEGGPTTSINVGNNTDSINVVEGGNGINEVTIVAKPRNGNTSSTLSENITEALGGETNIAEELEGITIDGVAAKRYEINQLTKDRYIFFEKDDIFYQIKTINIESDDNKQKLDDVIDGFKFN